jgi:hypothetical protein
MAMDQLGDQLTGHTWPELVEGFDFPSKRQVGNQVHVSPREK